MLNSQGLDGAQGSKQAFADSLQLVIVQRQQVEVLQVLEGVDPQTIDFIGVEKPGRTRGKLRISCFSLTFNTCMDLQKQTTGMCGPNLFFSDHVQ